MMDAPIVLFDGVCNFCNASVNFLLDHDTHRRFRFAALQSDTGQALLHRFGLRRDDFDTSVLVENGRAYTKSSAALRIARGLGGWWSLFAILLAIPPCFRDAAYDVFARNRYRWFGKMDTCRLPTPDIRDRFLA
jgi:predicted DCC family thiol-disulfide oxidoreductase YuxK